MDIRFDDQVVLVTGGTKGIGKTIAEAYAALGATVVVCARNQPDQLPRGPGSPVDFQRCDVRDPSAVGQMVDRIVADHGRLDVVVNNAGGSPPAEAATASPRFHAAIIDLNLSAPLHVAQRANTVMQEQPNGGVIINIASVSGTRPSPGTAAYGAAKAGLLNLTRSLAVEWAPCVRVVALSVGLVETELSHLHFGDAQGVARAAATVPLARLGVPQDVANACVWLASPYAAYISGAEIRIDGGGEMPRYLTEG